MRKGENIYKRKDGRWEGRYKKGYKSNGKIKYGYIYGKTFQEVRIKLYSLKVHYLTQQEVYGDACIPFEEWGKCWLQEIQQELKPSTYSSYQYKLTKYVFPFIGTHYLNELTSETGGELVMEWHKKGLQASTMHVILRITNKCLNYAKGKNKLKENPFSAIKLPKGRTKKIHALTKKEQQKLEEIALNEKKDRGLPTYLALYTGLRIGEIAALRWSDIDFEQNLITVSHTYQRVALEMKKQKTQLILGSPKTDSGIRTIPIGKKLRKELLKLKRKSNGSFVFSAKNQPMEPRLLTYHFHRIREKCGLENIHFHQLRHTFATRCLEAQGDILSVSALLGHASTKLTLDTYADSMLEQRIQVIVQMERTTKKAA
ncbi:tyrosine-type recombinase/integrase [Enterococcus sp.]|uniref:tyrosine-type recombinase/integrase n=1 Tax=Enterococcus sp. TaxID=35783 RepID=UPI002908EAF1|nr:tyrosine-type recombinase/integrase [Enterococcus sp.]MDU5336688.1 tyrosine-type recombinase/integrase [Enterococcus sp.]